MKTSEMVTEHKLAAFYKMQEYISIPFVAISTCAIVAHPFATCCCFCINHLFSRVFLLLPYYYYNWQNSLIQPKWSILLTVILPWFRSVGCLWEHVVRLFSGAHLFRPGADVIEATATQVEKVKSCHCVVAANNATKSASLSAIDRRVTFLYQTYNR